MKTVFLSRREYDRLVREQPEFMAVQYQEFNKNWMDAGVYVRGEAHLIELMMAFIGVVA